MIYERSKDGATLGRNPQNPFGTQIRQEQDVLHSR